MQHELQIKQKNIKMALLGYTLTGFSWGTMVGLINFRHAKMADRMHEKTDKNKTLHLFCIQKGFSSGILWPLTMPHCILWPTTLLWPSGYNGYRFTD